MSLRALFARVVAQPRSWVRAALGRERLESYLIDDYLDSVVVFPLAVEFATPPSPPLPNAIG